MAIPSYIKNVAKSFGYAISDTIKDYNPVIDSLLSDSKDTVEDVFTSIGSFKDDLLSGSEKTLKEEIKDSARDIWANFKDDITSGNLYRREKKDPLVNIAMQAAGLDMGDFDFDMEDWGDDEWTADDSQKAEVEQSTKNTKATVIAIDEASNRIISGVGRVQVQSTEYLANVTRNGNRALYDLNKRGFNNVSRALLGVNKSITAIAQLGKPLTDHMQNSTIFFTKTTESLEAIKTSLANIEKNTAIVGLASDRKSHGSKSTTFSDMFSEDSGLSISSYVNMVKENFGDNKWMVESLINGVKNLKNARSSGSFGKNISITTMAMQMISKALIPQALATAMKGFNDSLKAFSGAALIKFRDKDSGNFLLEWLKESLFPENKVKSISTSNYEKGRVAWDGISRKALIETIPGYLRMIYSAITGEDRVYDYDKGKFRYIHEIRSDFEESKRSIYKNDDFRKEAIKKLAAKRGVTNSNSAEMQAIEAEIDKFFSGAIYGSDDQRKKYHNFKDIDKLATTMGISSETAAIIYALTTGKRGAGNKFITDIEQYRDKYNRLMNDIEQNGDAAILNDLNGSTKIGKTSGLLSSRITIDDIKDTFSNAIDSLTKVIPNYLSILLMNQQTQLGAMGFNEGVYRYYNFKTGRWMRNGSTVLRSNMRNAAIPSRSRSREGKSKKGSSGGNNSSSSSDDDGGGESSSSSNYHMGSSDVPMTEEEIKREREETLDRAKKEAGNSRIGKFLKGSYERMKSIFTSKENAPGVVGSFAKMINSLTYTMDTMFFGKRDGDPNSISAVFRTEIKNIFEPLREFYDKHLKQYFDKFSNWLENKFPGIGLVKEKLKSAKNAVGDWVFDTFLGTNRKRTRQINSKRASYVEAQVADGVTRAMAEKEAMELYPDDTEEEIDQYAKGGTVRKTGLAVVSKGELIIPSEYNPYYKGPTNKASQIAAENNVEKRYFGKYVKGGIVGKGLDLGAEGLGQLISFFSDHFGSKDKNDKDDTNSLANKLKKLTETAFKGNDSQDNLAAMAAGGIIGGGVSLLTGAVVGPLFGAAIGAGAGLILNSKKVQKVLFGDVVNPETGEVEGGILGKKVSNFMVQQLPDMAKGAGVGAVGGLFLGSPVLGAILGGAVGFAKNSKTVQKYLFGEDVIENGENVHKDGLIPKSIQDKFKKGLPRAIAGAGIGLLAGPFGLVGSMVVGAGIGFMTTSEKFQETIINAGNAFTGFLTRTVTDIGDKLKVALFGDGENKKGLINIIGNLLTGDGKGKPGLINKLFGRLFKIGEFAFSIPMTIVSKYGEHRKKKNIAKGYNVYEKTLGRNMTASERNEARNSLGLKGRKAGNKEFDDFLLSLSSQDDLDALTIALANGENSFERNGKIIDLSKYSRGRRKNLISLVNSEKNAYEGGIRKSDQVTFYKEVPSLLSRISNKISDIINAITGKNKISPLEAKRRDYVEAQVADGVTRAMAEKEAMELYPDESEKTNDIIQDHANSAHNDRMTISTPGGIQQIVTEANGDQHPDMTDSTTKESVKKMDGLFTAISSIPVIGKGFSKLVDTFNNFKNGLHDMLFGEDNESGILGGLFSFFTGKVANFGGISAILSKFAGGAGIIGLTYALLSGKLDKLFSLIPGVGASRETSHSYTATTTDGRIVTKDTNGQWVDESGRVVSLSQIDSNSVSVSRSDVNAASQRFAISLASGTARYLSRVTTIDGANTVATLFRRIANGLKNSPILRKFVSEDTIENMFFDQSKGLYAKVATKLGPTGLKTASNIASTALVVLKVAMILADFSTGYEDARTTLGIFQEPTVPQRLVSGLVRTVKNLVPFIGTLIPDSLVVDVFCNFIGPIFHISPTSLIHQREESAQILEQYNAEHGTNLTTEQFIKDVMHDYTWTERIGNTARGTWESGKLMTSQIFSSIKDKGLLETYNIYKRQVSNTFSAAFNEEEGLLAGTINGIGAVMDETMPGIFGDIKKKKADIWKFAVKGELKDLWKVALDNFSGGGEQIEGTDLTTATTGYSSFMIGQMPLLMTKMIATPFAVASHSFHQMFGDTFEKMGSIIKNDIVTLQSNIKSMQTKSENGDISGIWNIEFNSSSSSSMSLWTNPIFKTANFVNKIIYIGKSLLIGIGDKLKNFVDDVKEKFDWVDDIGETVENLNEEHPTATSFLSGALLHNSIFSSGSHNGGGAHSGFGSGLAGGASGFVSQLDSKYNNISVGGMSTADNGCAPAVASMIASSYGKSYSMRSASNDANYYQNGGSGTTMDYFADTLGSRGINVGSINNEAGVYNSLRSGRPVVLLGQDVGNGSKTNSPFGPNNHYVMASGLDRRGNIIVNDPEARRPRSYSPSILRGVKAALGTSGRGSGFRRISAAGSRLNSRARNSLRKYYGGASEDLRGTIYSYFKSKGMSDYGIAGLMGCWECESGNRPNRVEGDYLKNYPGYDYVMSSNANMDSYVLNVLFPAYDASGVAINKDAYKRDDDHYYPGLGLAQWTRGRTYNLLQFAKSKGWDWRTLEAQLEYAWYELNTSYSGTLAKLNAARSVDEGTEIAYTNYEGCGSNYTTDKFLKRLEYAYNIYNVYSGDTNTFTGFDSSQSATSSSGGFFHNAITSVGNYISNSTVGHVFTSVADRFSAIRDSVLNSNKGPLGTIKGLFSGILGGLFNGSSDIFGSTNGTMSNFSNYGSYNSSSGYPIGYTNSYGATSNNGNDIYNNFPYFNQNDQPWGPVMYSYNNDPSATISTSGCGPTSAAMILKSYGVNTNPIETASYAFNHGYRVNGGTTGGLFPSIGRDAGLDVNNFQSTDTAKQYLSNNIPLVALMKKGDFTGGGHYVVISGYDPVTDTFTVNDSNSRPRSETRWDWYKMGQNATNFWSFSKDGVGSIGTYGNRKLQGDGKFNDVTAQKLNGWRNGLSGGSSGMYSTRAGSALRKWKRNNRNNIAGGASGLSSVNTPSSMAHIDAILNKATSQGSSSGNLSPSIIYELLAAIIQVLMNIAGNTGNNSNIAEMLAVYLPKLEAATGLTKEQLKSNIEQQARLNTELVKNTNEIRHPQNPNLNDVEPSVQKLKGILGLMATT